MRRSLGLTSHGLRLTGRPAAVISLPPPAPPTLLVTELGEQLVDESGHALAIRETTA